MATRSGTLREDNIDQDSGDGQLRGHSHQACISQDKGGTFEEIGPQNRGRETCHDAKHFSQRKLILGKEHGLVLHNVRRDEPCSVG